MSLEDFLVKTKHKIKVLMAASIMTFITSAVFAGDMNATQKKQVEGVVREYLVKNPDVVVQALQTYQQQQMDQARKTMEKTQQIVPKYAQDLFHVTSDPAIGNPSGKVTIVEFFDYQCGHCMEMAPVMDALIKANPNVRVVFKDFPIRGEASEIAAKAALAANMQGKYFEFHKALMAAHRALTEQDIFKIAKDSGLDVDKLKKDMSSEEVSKQIKATYELAKGLQLMGTPAIFIAKSDVSSKTPAADVIFIPGQVDQNQLEMVIKKLNG
jgi:protein-disulfide isomerase